MFYLRKFNENSNNVFDKDFNETLLKDIIVTIKDDYPKIDGNIKYTNDNNIILSLNCKPYYDESILGKIEYTTSYIESKNDFILKLTEILLRIEEAMCCKVGVFDLYRFDEPSSDGLINIYLIK